MHVPHRWRVRAGPVGSDDSAGNNGAFFVPQRKAKPSDRPPPLRVIATDGQCDDDTPADHPARDWEHVSVSLPDRCPTWEEMAYIKALFWDDEDCVIQFHPPRSAHVNNHPYCLHLWRYRLGPIPMPPAIAVGFPELNPAQVQALVKSRALTN